MDEVIHQVIVESNAEKIGRAGEEDEGLKP